MCHRSTGNHRAYPTGNRADSLQSHYAQPGSVNIQTQKDDAINACKTTISTCLKPMAKWNRHGSLNLSSIILTGVIIFGSMAILTGGQISAGGETECRRLPEVSDLWRGTGSLSCGLVVSMNDTTIRFHLLNPKRT